MSRALAPAIVLFVAGAQVRPNGGRIGSRDPARARNSRDPLRLARTNIRDSSILRLSILPSIDARRCAMPIAATIGDDRSRCPFRVRPTSRETRESGFSERSTKVTSQFPPRTDAVARERNTQCNGERKTLHESSTRLARNAGHNFLRRTGLRYARFVARNTRREKSRAVRPRNYEGCEFFSLGVVLKLSASTRFTSFRA